MKMNLAMRRAAVATALTLYENVPDAEDRAADALLALVEASRDFRPRPGQNMDGYAVRYVLGHVAGVVRNIAQKVKESSDAEVAEADLGIDSLFFDGPSELFVEENRLWVVDGKVTPESQILREHPEAQDLLNRLAADVESEFENPDPDLRYVYEPQPEPLFLSDIPDAEEVLKASRNNPTWDYEDLQDYEDIRVEVDTRPASEVTRDSRAWPKPVLELWRGLRQEWRYIANPAEILGWLKGEDIELPEDPCVHAIIEMMEALSVALLDEVDEDNFDVVARSVSRTLAEKIVQDGLTARTQSGSMVDELRITFADYFSAEPDEWEPTPLPAASSLKKQLAEWLETLDAWPSQKAGIQALLDGATPWEARKIEQATFSIY